jgi:hypothetical protein
MKSVGPITMNLTLGQMNEMVQEYFENHYSELSELKRVTNIQATQDLHSPGFIVTLTDKPDTGA